METHVQHMMLKSDQYLRVPVQTLKKMVRVVCKHITFICIIALDGGEDQEKDLKNRFLPEEDLKNLLRTNVNQKWIQHHETNKMRKKDFVTILASHIMFTQPQKRTLHKKLFVVQNAQSAER